MTDFQNDTEKSLLSIIDNLLKETTSKASQLSLFKLVNYNKSIMMELFSQNIDEYLYFMITQYITTSFSAGLKKAIVTFSEILVKSQDGQIQTNPEPYDLKFKLKNGEEYWLEIKSVNELYCSTFPTIKECRLHPENGSRKYRLFVYDDGDSPYDEECQLNGKEFWKLIAGFENAESEIFKTINGAANKLSLSSIIQGTQKRLLNEWRMHE